jgi:hypothetical protein
MSETTTLGRWFRDTWATLLGLSATLIMIALVTAAAVSGCRTPYATLATVWPDRLSAEVGATLPISVEAQDTVRVAGGEATLYRGRYTGTMDDLPAQIATFEELAAGTLDGDGDAVLSIPPVEPIGGDGTETLVLHLQIDGHDYWYRHHLASPDAPTMALTLDRPLYQPGQTMKMRTVVVSATTGRPVDGPVTWTIHDARGNLVFEQEHQTGANGVGSVQFTLADRCVQGTYRVTATHGDQSVTKSVDVRPFRLPRFTVDVELEAAEVEPGGTLRGQVDARYTYGEPVAESDVSLTARAAGMQLTGAAGKTSDTGLFDFAVDVPADAAPGTPIEISATVTSPAGRAEGGTASTRVAGRTLSVEAVPASRARFAWNRKQTGYLLVTDADGAPVADTELKLTIPEKGGERDVVVTTDEAGRAEFQWTPHPAASNYLSVSLELDDRTVDLNLRPTVDYDTPALETDTSMTQVGETLTARVDAARGGLVTLVRDGVALLSAPVDGEEVSFDIPESAAGLAHVVLLEDGARVDSVPVWIRQRGGDEVAISTDQTEYRPGKTAAVTLEFPPPRETTDDTPGVTFGLVGVDEALYALKERADVPLHILLRRAPETIDAALGTFDGVDEEDPAGVAIATSRFRQQIRSETSDFSRGADVSNTFRDYEKRPWLLGLMWFWLVGAFATLVQMIRWTWRSVSREAFTWRRAFGQFGFALFASVFAIAIAAFGQGEAWAGGLAVWIAVVVCWWVAAAARLRELPFGKWLGAHLLGVTFVGAAGACVEELSRGSSDIGDWFIIGAVVVPLVLAGIQWIVWAFVLMHRGESRSALGLASLVGIFTLGLGGFAMLAGGGAAPMVTKDAMVRQEEAPPSPPRVTDAPNRAPDDAMPEPEPKPAGSSAAEPRVRSWFPETMVWIPELPADEDGSATVDVELPDSITTWRLNAWANTTDGRFGEGEAPLRVVKPYFVQLDMPTEVIEGDEFDVPITLVNRTSKPLEVDYGARAEGALALRGGEGDTARLAAGERRIVWLRLRADRVGEGSVTVSSTSAAGNGDAVKRSLHVAPDGRTLRHSASGIIGEGWSEEVLIPRDAIAGTSIAEVRIFASLVADAIAGLSSMVRQPMGCFEQTSSANYPNVMILRALEDIDPEQWPDGADAWHEAREEATEMVRLGYQRILTFQQPAGGFALYPDDDPDVMLTAYGILQLVWAQDVTTVDDGVIANAANWLSNQQNDNGGWPVERRGVAASWRAGDDVGQVRATSFAVMALLATGDDRWHAPAEKGLDRIEKRVVSVESANALAYAANALAAGGRADAAKKVVDRLAAMAKRDGDLAYWSDDRATWMGGRNQYASRESTAIAAQALLETETQAELLQPALNWISTQRSGYGGWGSTQATVWTLRVLETLRQRSSERAVLEFSYDGEALKTGLAEEPLVVESGPQPLRQFDFTPRSRDGVFDVDTSAETTAMIQLVTEYAVGWDSRHAELDDEPFGAVLELESRDLRRGRATEALVRVENADATPVNMTIVEAPVPPGAFVSSDSLDELQRAGKIDAYEILPTHVRFYVTTIPAETERVWAYEFVPLVAGTFSMPPVRAYPFYSPEPMTEVDGGDVRVE